MTIETLKKRNPSLPIYTTDDAEFAAYGVVLDLDTTEICRVAEGIERPAEGSLYAPATPAFEALPIAAEIAERVFGTLPTQVGYCHGHSNFLNALEWHADSECNIAVTDLVLLLAKREELVNNRLDSSAVKAFYIKKGQAIEVFATSLHFCPCEVEPSGFGCVVGLPRGTNMPLEAPVGDPYLFRRNKWLIAHEQNAALIARGALPGIGGENIEVKR